MNHHKGIVQLKEMDSKNDWLVEGYNTARRKTDYEKMLEQKNEKLTNINRALLSTVQHYSCSYTQVVLTGTELAKQTLSHVDLLNNP